MNVVAALQYFVDACQFALIFLLLRRIYRLEQQL